DLAGVLAQMESTVGIGEATGLAGDSLRDGKDLGSGGGRPNSQGDEQTTAELFGISGSGTYFLYVFDRSDSMNGFGGKPLRAAKRELIRSLKSLTDRQRFQVIFYNETPKPLQITGMPLQLLPGSPNMLKRAVNYVEATAAFGGTHHDSALRMALRMSPDVIFFLTDATVPRLSETQLRDIRNRAQSNGTTIHAIEFGAGPSQSNSSFLKQLAAQNQGQYRYFDVTQL
ncbi:MAG: VWA domain-containing protein, partial [Planctomycetota bacterium]